MKTKIRLVDLFVLLAGGLRTRSHRNLGPKISVVERSPSDRGLSGELRFYQNRKRSNHKRKHRIMKVIIVFAVALLAGVITASQATAQTNPIFLQLGQAKGALYKPDSGPAPHVGIVVMHREANYMNNIACTEFFQRIIYMITLK